MTFGMPLLAVVLLCVGVFLWWWSGHTWVPARSSQPRILEHGQVRSYAYTVVAAAPGAEGEKRRTVRLTRPWESAVTVRLGPDEFVEDSRALAALRRLPATTGEVVVEAAEVSATVPASGVADAVEALADIADWSLTLPPRDAELVDLSWADPSRPQAERAVEPAAAAGATLTAAPEPAEAPPVPKPQRMTGGKFGDADGAGAAGQVGEDRVEPIAAGRPDEPTYSETQGTRVIRKQGPSTIF
ncbi:MAG: hypothetical protein SPI77_01170 [Corynebacterium sp.]|nr:hypothetical protein [Corynebacterium sp.]